MAFKIRYNSPVVLTFALACMVVYFVNWIFFGNLQSGQSSIITSFFMLTGHFSFGNPLDYFKLISYTMGHADHTHLLGNMSIFLLIAPIMEEKYGSVNVLIMMLLTAVLTAVFQIMLFDTALLGASGIVFMFIILVSFADARKGSIPLSFILVIILYIGKEVLHSLEPNEVSEYAHIAGGFFGGVFAIAMNTAKKEDALESADV